MSAVVQERASDEDEPALITAFCPRCGEEALEVTVEHAGSAPNHTFGLVEHWFEGEGVCYECGWQGAYSDTSL